MDGNRCAHCNAPLPEGISGCDYCGVGARVAPPAGPPVPPAPVKDARRSKVGTVLKIAVGTVSLTCCGPLGIFGAFYETVYAVRMEAPKYSARPPPVEQRPVEAIEPMQVFLDMRDTEDRPVAQRKQEWRERYEGRWVSWKGIVDETLVYDTMTSELRLRPLGGQEFGVQVYLDPLHNERLKQLRKGQEVRVSGRLWGYYFIPNTARLSEGALVDANVPAQVQDLPR
jgi:hypothetical protein